MFRIALSKVSSGAAATASRRKFDYIAVKAVFNWGLSSSKLETVDSQKSFEILTRLPEHRNLFRLLFECVCTPPVWMVEMLPDPSLVCIDAGDDDDDEDVDVDEDEDEMPTRAGNVAAQLLHPREAQMMGIELLQRRMCDHMQILQLRETGSVPDDVLVQLSRDIAEGVHHLLKHGVVHRDLKLDNVMWDSKGWSKGGGACGARSDLGCSLACVRGCSSGSAAAATAVTGAASASSSSSSSSYSFVLLFIIVLPRAPRPSSSTSSSSRSASFCSASASTACVLGRSKPFR